MDKNFTPMERQETRVYLGRSGGFDVRDCPDAEDLAQFIVTACNEHDHLVGQVATLNHNLEAARSRANLLAETAIGEQRVKQQLVDKVEQLRDDLNDARNGLDSAAEELRQADALRDRLAAALKLAKEALEHSAPVANQYEEPRKRHAGAKAAVNEALAAAGTK
jgi:chromosome segregation ATPase